MNWQNRHHFPPLPCSANWHLITPPPPPFPVIIMSKLRNVLFENSETTPLCHCHELCCKNTWFGEFVFTVIFFRIFSVILLQSTQKVQFLLCYSSQLMCWGTCTWIILSVSLNLLKWSFNPLVLYFVFYENPCPFGTTIPYMGSAYFASKTYFILKINTNFCLIC